MIPITVPYTIDIVVLSTGFIPIDIINVKFAQILCKKGAKISMKRICAPSHLLIILIP